MGVAVVVALFLAIALAVFLGQRGMTNARALLTRGGFTLAATIPVTLPLKKRVTRLDCFAGELWPGCRASVFIACSALPKATWSTPYHVIGVYVPSDARLPDGWVAAWEHDADAEGTSRPMLAEPHAEGGCVVMWHALDTRENVERILMALGASAPART